MNGDGIHRGRLWQMVRKELRQMLRDPRSKQMLFAAPVAQLLMFGYAVTTDVRHAPTYVVDHDRTVESRQMIDALTDRKSTRLNSSHIQKSRMPSSA